MGCMFEAERQLSRKELWALALKMYPRSEKKLKAWKEEDWERFEKRLFDVSEFMRKLQGAFARWYNRTYDRKGRFWGDRFKSTLLADGGAVLDAMLYVDLNPVRAGLEERPEAYAGSSFYLRALGKAPWLADLRLCLDANNEKEALDTYRRLLYYRGAVRTRGEQAAISPALLAAEEARGFKESGIFLRRLRHFTDGLVVGGETVVRQQLVKLKRAGRFLRRKNPIAQAGGNAFSAREQRSHFVAMS